MIDEMAPTWWMRAAQERKGFIGVSCPRCHRIMPENEEGRAGMIVCRCDGELADIGEVAATLGLDPGWFVPFANVPDDVMEIIR